MSSVRSIRVGYPHILNLPSCHTDSTTTRAYPHIIESPLRQIPVSLPSFLRPSAPSFPRPCRHSSVPLRRHSRVPHVIPPSLCAVIPASLTSFPRPSRHSRVGGNPSNLAPDMRTHADDDATNRAAAQIWKKGRRGCRVIAERRT